MYFKITNKDENHHGFQYVDGLNILVGNFNDDPNKSCCIGGLYFTDIDNIFNFFDYGVYLREIFLPESDPKFRMVKDGRDKYRANMIILGKRYELSDFNTFKYLIEKGANKNDALNISAKNGYLEVVKYLVKEGADVRANHACASKWNIENALNLSAGNGHLDVVKYLVEEGADIHSDNNCALQWSAENGHLAIVIFLAGIGTNIHAYNDAAFRWSAENGHLEVVKYLVERGANIHSDNDYALKRSAKNGHLEVVKYLETIALKN